MQGKKIPLPQYNVVATHGAAHNQEFEIECLIPKLDIQVFGAGGSRRAGEQAAAKLALDAVQHTMVKTPTLPKKPRQRTAQLKLAGIAAPDAITVKRDGKHWRIVETTMGSRRTGISRVMRVATLLDNDIAF